MGDNDGSPVEPVAEKDKIDAYREVGLEAGETIHDIQPSFTLEDAKDALFRSTYSNPYPLEVQVDESTPPVKMVITSAEQRYESYGHAKQDSPLGVSHDRPAWKFEGWLMKSGFDPYGEVVRVRLVFMPDNDTETSVYFQRIPVNPDPNAELFTG